MADFKICIMGDSQTAGVESNYDLQGVAIKLRYQGHYDIENLAVGSTTLADALGFWNALSSDRQAEFDYVFIAGFNNDLNEVTTVATYIASAQTLVNQVRADNPTCKIIMSTCVPVLNYWEDSFGGDPEDTEAYHDNWLGVNEALQGLGATPITGVQGCATEHTDYLNDGSDSLQTKYCAGVGNSDLLHPNGAGEDVIADSWKKFIV